MNANGSITLPKRVIVIAIANKPGGRPTRHIGGNGPVVGTSKGVRSSEANWKAAVAPGTADGDARAEGVVEHDDKAGHAITIDRCAE